MKYWLIYSKSLTHTNADPDKGTKRKMTRLLFNTEYKIMRLKCTSFIIALLNILECEK